ncbi:universal stress protein UspE [Alteromonas sp. 1_MG-2023]|uniref:universal stress protein UspE n=1 Tax=Alteromonas sp. 1_MG-2023 TaxID=3062669 RepID=UPI0026E2D591|nr:universal stress protein UspE [Alteromonas sp. 1_MG-2023]MDO6476832.1 universal stress protein UspE [Alteromonas sp. 1_MG-2023]
MITCKRILAVVQADNPEQPALSRAIEIARKTGAEVHALLVVYDFSYDMTTMLTRSEREAMRDAVTKDRIAWAEKNLTRYDDYDVKVAVEWSDKRYEAITRYTINRQVDLVVKATRKHDDFASVLFTPTDWHLLRKCPAPVLLVKAHAWPEHGNIVAAVNVGTEDKEHAQLNDKLTGIAKDYAELLSGQVHLVNAYPSAPLNIAIEIPDFNPETYHNAVRNHHVQEMENHSAKFGIGVANCHVVEGLPDIAIPKVTEQLDAELVVIGTVGRTGISAAFLGNTAEHVIDNLNCDVLAVKPDGFTSPVK